MWNWWKSKYSSALKSPLSSRLCWTLESRGIQRPNGEALWVIVTTPRPIFHLTVPHILCLISVTGFSDCFGALAGGAEGSDDRPRLRRAASEDDYHEGSRRRTGRRPRGSNGKTPTCHRVRCTTRIEDLRGCRHRQQLESNVVASTGDWWTFV